MRVRAVVVGVAVILGSLVAGACGGDDTDEGAEPSEQSTDTTGSSTSTSPTSTSEPESGDSGADCPIGEWSLDTADYSAQAQAYLGGLGIPVESVTVTGEQVVTFQDEVMDLRTDLQVDAVVAGTLIRATSQDAGNGEWALSDGALTVENWLWGLEPTPAAPGAPSVPLFDPTAGAVTTTCDGDALSLQGSGAPLVGNFVRR